MAEKEISVLICKPQSKPELGTIENRTEIIKEIIGGDYIIHVVEEDGLSILYDPDGKDVHTLNRLIGGEPIFGTVIFCRSKGQELFSLSEDELEDMNYLLS
ncbi:DUF3846 domain-containing protein [Syntrophobotulus glycolicus]|nr:DUF3846 domain-containing protein [Syntrophobotulus glycolicus]